MPALESGSELRKLPLFAELSPSHLADVLACAEVEHAPRDRLLVAEGEVSATIPVLLQGLVKVATGRVIMDVFKGPGIPLASAIFPGTPSFAAVVAVRSCEVAVINRATLLEVLHSSATAYERLTELVSNEAGGYLRRVHELVGGSVEERLSTLLDRLADRYGSPLEDGRFMALPLRRCDLAQMVHATTETVSRTLAEWERRDALRSTRAGLWWCSRRARAGGSTTPPARSKSSRPPI